MIRGDLSIIGGPSLELVTKLSSELLGFKIPSLVGDFGSMLYSRTYSIHISLWTQSKMYVLFWTQSN